MTEKVLGKTKAHTRYRLEDGKTIVPGVTTVLSVLSKPALVKWANNLGLKGIDSSKYVDALASIGTLAHLMVTDYVSKSFVEREAGIVPDYSKEYSKEEISKAENSFMSFLKWEERYHIEKPAIFVERPLVHYELKFGGTGDIYCVLDGKLSLIELKTSKGIWPEHVYQTAANKKILEFHGFPVEQVFLVNIPRSEDESFNVKFCSQRELDVGWEVFTHCLAIYNLRKEK